MMHGGALIRAGAHIGNNMVHSMLFSMQVKLTFKALDKIFRPVIGCRSNLPAKMREALGLDEGGDGVYGWNAPPCDESDAPPPYIPRNAFNRGAQKSLKQSQV